MGTLKLTGLETVQVTPLTLVFLVKDGKVLTIHRAKDKKIYPDRLHGIGGKVEPVDHVKLYLSEILSNNNFYTGMGYYEQEELLQSADSVEYYKGRV